MQLLKDRLKIAREKEGLSQSDMANLLNISRQGYNHYETGKRIPTLEMLNRISKILHVTTDYLLDDEQSEQWQDSEEMNAVKSNFPVLFSNLLDLTCSSSDENQKAIFNILIELKHVLALGNLNEVQKSASIELLQSMFSISTRFIDICSNLDKMHEEQRLVKMKQASVEQVAEVFTDAQKSIVF